MKQEMPLLSAESYFDYRRYVNLDLEDDKISNLYKMADAETDHIVNYKNYYVYADMVKDRSIRKVIYVPADLSISNIDDHIDGIFNILTLQFPRY